MFTIGCLDIGIRTRGAGTPAGASPVFTTNFLALSALPTGVSLSRATTGTDFDGSGVRQTAAIDAARFDHAWNGSAWVAAGLLIEEQRTNLVTHSTDLTNASWSPQHILSRTAVTGIDGTSSAFNLVPDTASGAHLLVSNSFTLGPTSFRCQAIVTANGYNQFAFRESGVTGSSAVFLLSGAGSISGTYSGGSVVVSNGSIKSLGSGRYLISCLMTTSDTSNPYSLGLSILDGSWSSGDPNIAGFAGDGVKGIIVECTQVEVGSFATSYIPTTTAAVTRSADIPSASSPLDGYLAAGPSVWEFQDEATGAISRTAYAAGAFDWPVNKWYRSMGVYPSGTDTSSHMTVGSAY